MIVNDSGAYILLGSPCFPPTFHFHRASKPWFNLIIRALFIQILILDEHNNNNNNIIIMQHQVGTSDNLLYFVLLMIFELVSRQLDFSAIFLLMMIFTFRPIPG
jgi:hypothetical protein